MRITYQRLVDDHQRIDHAAAALLAAADVEQADPTRLSRMLDGLAEVVHDHVAEEDVMVGRVSLAEVPRAWDLAWRQGLAEFHRLRVDWLTFLAAWTADAIARAPAEFCADAGDVLGRLRERVRLETDAWYSVALQLGAMALR